MTYRKIACITWRYVLLIEYFSAEAAVVRYRGFHWKLFKRDFAGEFLGETKGQFSAAACGFLWKRIHPAWDNTTWVLLERAR